MSSGVGVECAVRWLGVARWSWLVRGGLLKIWLLASGCLIDMVRELLFEQVGGKRITRCFGEIADQNFVKLALKNFLSLPAVKIGRLTGGRSQRLQHLTEKRTSN
jgi:hypothetical protein